MDLRNVIKEAVRQSSKANYVFRLGAVIFNNDRVIGAGYNRVSENGAICAELLAIKKSPRKLLKGASILVVRVRKSGTLGLSKPCERCQKIIIKSGIAKVIYSTPNGWESWNTSEEI